MAEQDPDKPAYPDQDKPPISVPPNDQPADLPAVPLAPPPIPVSSSSSGSSSAGIPPLAPPAMPAPRSTHEEMTKAPDVRVVSANDLGPGIVGSTGLPKAPDPVDAAKSARASTPPSMTRPVASTPGPQAIPLPPPPKPPNPPSNTAFGPTPPPVDSPMAPPAVGGGMKRADDLSGVPASALGGTTGDSATDVLKRIEVRLIELIDMQRSGGGGDVRLG